MHRKTDSSTEDWRVMHTFHYKQELRRTLRFFGSFAVALSFISLTTGIFTNYGILLKNSGPAGIWTWPIVAIGQTLVALVFAEMASRMPLTGYSYQWASRLGGPAWGWFTGWVCVSFFILVIPAVDLGLAPVFARLLNIETTTQNLVIITVCTLILQAVIHISGVKLASRINSSAVFTEIVVMVGLIVIFLVLTIKNRPSLDILFSTGTGNAAGLSSFRAYLPAFVLASLMGAFTLVGFESAANLSEETVDASRTVPKAVVSSVVWSGFIGTLFLIFTVLNIKDLPAVTNSVNSIPMIIESNLGPVAGRLFFVLVVISIFACGLVIMLSGSRLVYAMSRDKAFPLSGLFCRVSPHTSVPIPAILFLMVTGIIATVFAESLTFLLAATSVLPAMIYLLTIAAYTVRRNKMPTKFGHFNLGKWGKLISLLAICWLLLLIAVLTFSDVFKSATKAVIIMCAVGLFYYIFFVDPRIAKGTAGVHAIENNTNNNEKQTGGGNVGD